DPRWGYRSPRQTATRTRIDSGSESAQRSLLRGRFLIERLPLVVVAQHEQALLTQVQLRRKILQVRQDRLDQLVRDATVLRLRDVVLGQTKQLREDISGRCGSGAKVAVANRCVDARVGVL